MPHLLRSSAAGRLSRSMEPVPSVHRPGFAAGGGGLMVGPTDGAGVDVGVAACSSLRPPGAAAVAFVVLPPTDAVPFAAVTLDVSLYVMDKVTVATSAALSTDRRNSVTLAGLPAPIADADDPGSRVYPAPVWTLMVTSVPVVVLCGSPTTSDGSTLPDTSAGAPTIQDVFVSRATAAASKRQLSRTFPGLWILNVYESVVLPSPSSNVLFTSMMNAPIPVEADVSTMPAVSAEPSCSGGGAGTTTTGGGGLAAGSNSTLWLRMQARMERSNSGRHCCTLSARTSGDTLGMTSRLKPSCGYVPY
mmetsp:Transcript_35388/g.88511  ORF Transcript_35388/g.88511 Transcript_35388/m.88511 type:complete len:304 (-) Transcript_35388:778-1689(-)